MRVTKCTYESMLNDAGFPETKEIPKTKLGYGSWMRKHESREFDFKYWEYADGGYDKPKSIRIVDLVMVKDRTIEYGDIVSPRDVAKISSDFLAGSHVEQCLVIGLDTRNNPTCIHVVTTGGVAQCSCEIPNIFKPLLLSNATSFIFVHNHPSDTMSPSASDLIITNKIKEAGNMMQLKMVDHVIVNSDCTEWLSIKSTEVL